MTSEDTLNLDSIFPDGLPASASTNSQTDFFYIRSRGAPIHPQNRPI
jgi:hypothetical protein